MLYRGLRLYLLRTPYAAADAVQFVAQFGGERIGPAIVAEGFVEGSRLVVRGRDAAGAEWVFAGELRDQQLHGDLRRDGGEPQWEELVRVDPDDATAPRACAVTMRPVGRAYDPALGPIVVLD